LKKRNLFILFSLLGGFFPNLLLANCTGGSPFAEDKAKAQNGDCETNFGAKHDASIGSSMFRKDHVCHSIYETIVEKIDDYDLQRSKSCSEISSLVKKAESCQNDECFEEAKTSYKQAATKERELASLLKQTKSEVSDLHTAAEEVMKNYREDNQKMIAALQEAEKSKVAAEYAARAASNEREAMGKVQEAQKMFDLINTAKGVSGNKLTAPPSSDVSSSDGVSGGTILQYQKAIPKLVEEQRTAQLTAESFQSKIDKQSTYHESQAKKYEQLAGKSLNRKEEGVSHKDDSSNGNKKNVENASNNSEITDPQKSAAEGGGSPSGGGGGAPTGGGAPGNTPTSQSDPYASSVDTGSDPSKTKEKISLEKGKSKEKKNSFDVSAMSKKPNNDELKNRIQEKLRSTTSTDPKKEFNLAPERSPATQSAAGASTASSAGSLGSAGGTSKNSSEDKKVKFGEDLNSGGMDIAGSDIASAVDSFGEELGIQDDGALTEAEKEALSLTDESASDPTILEQDSQALFARTKQALVRAQERGNVVRSLAKN
jgi:hypothetical protein